MGRLRDPWARAIAVWTLLLILVAVVIAAQAMWSLYDANQACFFSYPATPCPAPDDPRLARLAIAFVGMPLLWLAGMIVAILAWAVRRR